MVEIATSLMLRLGLIPISKNPDEPLGAHFPVGALLLSISMYKRRFTDARSS